ncbi:ferritin-2, chloroplastic isoform X2 [Arachis hypogaea]|uniref:ferritin-2, chloroplastic isoform X2 n=1 Tax=Arachis hypogaea TaxID=3818 RepID=UPI0034E72E7C
MFRWLDRTMLMNLNLLSMSRSKIDDIALKGFAKFFKESSEEEREHAEELMKYQNIRGGRVIQHPITSPPSEFAHAQKGDALYGC